MSEKLVERTENAKRWLSWTIRVRTDMGNGFGRKHSYEGTVPESTVAKRRAKNKIAKRSRKLNRSK